MPPSYLTSKAGTVGVPVAPHIGLERLARARIAVGNRSHPEVYPARPGLFFVIAVKSAQSEMVLNFASIAACDWLNGFPEARFGAAELTSDARPAPPGQSGAIHRWHQSRASGRCCWRVGCGGRCPVRCNPGG